MTIIMALLGDAIPYIAGAVALLGAWFGNSALQRRKGRKAAIDEAEEADNEHAANIRNRVDNADDVLHKYDDAGFRD